MAILRTCCCWKSVRSGSFASGIYTLIFYTVVVAIAAFHIDPVIDNAALLSLGFVVLVLSGVNVMTSALLLVGVCVDNRRLLIPWLISISTTTVLDIFLSFYFISEWVDDPQLVILFVIDYFLCGINIYCLLCVVSQYQEYLAGRGRPEDCIRIESPTGPRSLKFHWPSFEVLSNPPYRGTPVSSDRSKSGNLLTVPDPMPNNVMNDAPCPTNACDSTSRLINVGKIKDDVSVIESSPPSTRSVTID